MVEILKKLKAKKIGPAFGAIFPPDIIWKFWFCLLASASKRGAKKVTI